MVTMNAERTMTVPEVYPEHEHFWQAAEKGTLLLKQCNDCNEVHYYPRAFCPSCYSEQVEWIEASGKGTIYTYSVMRVGTPYAIAFVELEEGIRIMTNIVDCDLDTLTIGQPVQVTFKQTGSEDAKGPFVACFTPRD